jgi:hypothetical protein
MEEPAVPDLEIAFLTLTAIGLVVGIWGIFWAKTGRATGRVSFGRVLFVAALLFLGISSLVAAFYRAEGLVPMGLSAGGLVIVMLW